MNNGCLFTEARCKVEYDLKKYSILVSLDSYWVCQQVTWCNGRSVDGKGSLDLKDCAEAPQFFIILIQFDLDVLLPNKPQCNVNWNGYLETIWSIHPSRQGQF